MCNAPNWLVCASCASPLVERSELHSLVANDLLRDAVYVYDLEILGRELSVFSATNPGGTRFDVVRAVLEPDIAIPSAPVSHPSIQESLEGFFQYVQHHAQAGSVQQHALAQQHIQEEPVQQHALVHQHAQDGLVQQHALLQQNAPHENEANAQTPDDSDEQFSEDGGYAQLTTDGTSESSYMHCRRVRCEGSQSDQHSWFSGYTWNFALCQMCSDHIGWAFYKESQQVEFFGFIVTKLREKYLPV